MKACLPGLSVWCLWSISKGKVTQTLHWIWVIEKW